MKGFLLFIIGLFSVMSSYAKCGNNGLYVFPKGKNIKQNSIFILEGYADSQGVITKLNKEYPIYLQSGDKKVKLEVVETHKGQFELTQAILKPETELEAGLEYTLYIGGDEHIQNVLTRYNSLPITYTVLPEKDLTVPEVVGQSKVLRKEYIIAGCGPESFVAFSNPAKDDSELLVKTTVKSLNTGKKTTYYLQPTTDKIEVGFGMCSGAFRFNDGDNYEVEFVFMDSAGNIADTKVDKIKFTKPKVKHFGPLY